MQAILHSGGGSPLLWTLMKLRTEGKNIINFFPLRFAFMNDKYYCTNDSLVRPHCSLEYREKQTFASTAHVTSCSTVINIRKLSFRFLNKMFYGWIEKFRQFTKTLPSIVLLQNKIVNCSDCKGRPPL